MTQELYLPKAKKAQFYNTLNHIGTIFLSQLNCSLKSAPKNI